MAATTGSANGASTPTNAHGSSAPAEYTPRGRPWIGDRQTTSTPFASNADASVSPSNPVSSRPSNVNGTTLERSIAEPRPVQPSHADGPARNSSVDVSRTTSNHRRHPAACIHRSANSPFGLSRMKR